MGPIGARYPHIELQWDVQPLEGFEARPIAAAARNYDLVIFDHPHVGEIAAGQLFVTVDPLLRDSGLGAHDFAGPSLRSYQFGGSTWGLPLDAACQVGCVRAELLNRLDRDVPQTWTEVLEIGRRARARGWQLAIGLRGVHSLMTLLSLCANLGHPLGSGTRSQTRSVHGDSGTPEQSPAFGQRDIPLQALEAIRQLIEYCPAEVLDWNSIAAQEAMSSRDDLVLCPAVYGFSPYARAGRTRRLNYCDLPGLLPGAGGSTLGGAGVGISAWSKHPEAAANIARLLVDREMQCNCIALNEGQPALAAAWDSPQVQQHVPGFYATTRQTLERAWVRPTHAGYPGFQRSAGPVVEQFLRQHRSAQATLDRLEALWARSLTTDCAREH